jgi:hypothetical protein
MGSAGGSGLGEDVAEGEALALGARAVGAKQYLTKRNIITGMAVLVISGMSLIDAAKARHTVSTPMDMTALNRAEAQGAERAWNGWSAEKQRAVCDRLSAMGVGAVVQELYAAKSDALMQIGAFGVEYMDEILCMSIRRFEEGLDEVTSSPSP